MTLQTFRPLALFKRNFGTGVSEIFKKPILKKICEQVFL